MGSYAAQAAPATPNALAAGKSPLSEQLAGDHQALDLRSALVDLNQLRIAHQLLYGELLDVAVTAVDLDRVGGHPHRHVCREALGIAGDQRVALSGVEHPGAVVGEEPSRLNILGHVRYHELDRLELADRLSKLLALVGVVDRVLERRAGDPHREHRGERAAVVQRLHGDPEAVALRAD